MIKRMNKATSLLIAAAAMISIIPASAADVKKIDNWSLKIVASKLNIVNFMFLLKYKCLKEQNIKKM